MLTIAQRVRGAGRCSSPTSQCESCGGGRSWCARGCPTVHTLRVTTPRQCILLLQSSVSGRSVISPATLQCFAREAVPNLTTFAEACPRPCILRTLCGGDGAAAAAAPFRSFSQSARVVDQPMRQQYVNLLHSIPWTLCSVVRGSIQQSWERYTSN